MKRRRRSWPARRLHGSIQERRRQCARKLQEQGAGTVIVKLGEQGCVLVEDDEALLMAAPKVKAVDTTAAGDVFNAGLAVALSEGMNLADACGYANCAAAISVTRPGAQGAAPSRRTWRFLRGALFGWAGEDFLGRTKRSGRKARLLQQRMGNC